MRIHLLEVLVSGNEITREMNQCALSENKSALTYLFDIREVGKRGISFVTQFGSQERAYFEYNSPITSQIIKQLTLEYNQMRLIEEIIPRCRH